MLLILLLPALALAAGWASYRWLEPAAASRAAMACRGVGLAGLVLLLLDPSCSARGSGEPLVLLDRSPSTDAPGGPGTLLADSARRLGEVVPFGTAGVSHLAPALRAAAASSRPLVVVTDGEVQDAAELEGPVLARARVLAVPRAPVADVALTRLDVPTRAVAGDTLTVAVTWRAFEGAGTLPDSLGLVLAAGERALARGRWPLAAARAVLRLPATRLGEGTHVLSISTEGPVDVQPDTDRRHAVVHVAPTPGLVLLARSADWDARFLWRTVQEVTDLPVVGYLHLGAAGWRRMGTLAPATDPEVRRATQAADVLILKGVAPEAASGTGARAVLHWPSGAGGATVAGGDWYLTAPGSAPLPALSAELDSLPPLTRVTPVEAPTDGWVLGTAQLGRRGTPRPVITGRAGPRGREATVWADGFWRWSFRGGRSEQEYRTVVASLVSWMLADPGRQERRLRPVAEVVERGRPVRFRWAGDSMPARVPITFVEDTVQVADTLRFDAGGHAEVALAPGTWQFASEAGGGLVVVERYNAELLPGPVTLVSREAALPAPGERRPLRGLAWMYLAVVAAFGAEWWARRRSGLR